MNALLVISHIVLLGTTVVSGSPKDLGRVTGGRTAMLGEAPYIVAFIKGNIFCAGSIIHQNWVLTSAQCLEENEDFEIIAGLHTNYELQPEENPQMRRIPNDTYIVLHDYIYDDNFVDIDAGLVFIEEPFKLGKSFNVDVVGLPPGIIEGDLTGDAKLYGYGYTSGGNLPNGLQVLETKVITLGECAEMVEQAAPLVIHNICTDGPQGICLFDTGAPLVRNTTNGVELIGISSWGESPCDSRSSPSIYTRVDLLIEWINKTIRTFKRVENCKSKFSKIN